MTLLAAIAVGMLFLVPNVFAQDASTVEYPEGGTDAVATFTADDPEGVTPIIWTIAATGDPDGAAGDLTSADTVDAAHFDINEDGELEFAIGTDGDPPDYEASTTGDGGGDADNDNTYHVVVAAADAEDGETAYHKITVKVTDEDEDGVVTWTVDHDGDGTADSPKLIQFQVGAKLTASATDGDIAGAKAVVMGDGVVGEPVWEWYRGSAKIENPATDPNTYTVTLDDRGKSLRVKVTYTVAGNVNQESASLTSDYRVLAARVGNHELEFDPDEIDRSVAEGEKGRNVGAPVRATGNHGVVNYTLAGDGADNAKFEIDQKTGQITTKWDLDHDIATQATAEAAGNCDDENSCVVTVIATDASGEAAEAATVTITLTDVNEKPEFTDEDTAASPKTIEREENMTALADSGSEEEVTYAATDPEGLNVNLTLMGPDGDEFQLSGAGVLEFREKPDFEDPTDRGGDNVYEVTVRASDGTLHEDRMVSVTVTGVDEAPEIMITSGVVANTPPEFASAATTRTVAEDAAVGADIGARVEATDDDSGDTLTYRLSGADRASFRINSATGQLSTAVALDFDRKDSYSVTVTATDSAGASDAVTVTITVTDVDEPGIPDDANNDGMIDKSEVITAFRAYVAGDIDKAQIIKTFRQYVADTAGSQ